jgi:glycosyltransferase involved in cell wall biosynthesis
MEPNRYMNPPRISVVVPAYNVAAFISETLDSVFSQAFQPFEVVIINDGSTDDTADLVRDRYAHYECVRIVDQDNQGVGAARQKGLELATGEYVFFVDPDDILAPGLFQSFADQVQASPALELYYFSKRSFVQSNQIREFLRRDTATTRGGFFDSGCDVLQDLILSGKYNAATWQYIFSRSICDRFTARFAGRAHEDHLFSMSIYLHAGQTYADQADQYFQRVRPGSLTQKAKDTRYVLGAYQAYRDTLAVLQPHMANFATGRHVAQVFMLRNVDATILKCVKFGVTLPDRFFAQTRSDVRSFGILSPGLSLRFPELLYARKKSRTIIKTMLRSMRTIKN